MLWYSPLGKSWQLGSYPSVKESLPVMQEESTGFPNALYSPPPGHKYKPLGLQWFRLCWCFSFLVSYREKSLEMQNCLWVVVAEKGKVLKWKTQIRSVNMYLNWWNLRVWWIWSVLLHIRVPGHKQSPWHDWQWYNTNVFVFVICRKTLKQDRGFIALGDVNALAWLIPIWFIYSWILFLYKNPLQAMPFLKNIAFPCWLNACNLWSTTVAAWMGGSSLPAFVLKWHPHKDILYWGSSWQTCKNLLTNRWPGFNIHYLEWMAPYSKIGQIDIGGIAGKVQ